MEVRVTQGTIARRAGVHTTTVSLALRDHPSIPVATRRRLQALAAELGYRPDPALRALMAYRGGLHSRQPRTTLAYLTGWNTCWGWKNYSAHHEFFLGAAARAEALGATLEHFWVREPGLKPQRLGGILAARGIRGVVLASHSDEAAPPLDLPWDELHAVKIDYHPPAPRLSIVSNDQRAIMQDALHAMRAAGYRRIGVVMPHWWDDYCDLAWSGGLLAAQSRLPATERVPLLTYAEAGPGFSARSDLTVPRDRLAGWLDEHAPDAILSYGPFVLPVLAALGRRVPEDIAFADLLLNDETGQRAGMRQNCRRVGEVAVETVLHQLCYNLPALSPSPTTTLVEGTWCAGASLPLVAAPSCPAAQVA